MCIDIIVLYKTFAIILFLKIFSTLCISYVSLLQRTVIVRVIQVQEILYPLNRYIKMPEKRIHVWLGTPSHYHSQKSILPKLQ